MLGMFRKPTTQQSTTQKAPSTKDQLYNGESVKNSNEYAGPSQNNHYTSYNSSHSQYDNYSELRHGNIDQPRDIGCTGEYYEDSNLYTQQRMPVESLGYRTIQDEAAKAVSPEELRRQHQNTPKPVQQARPAQPNKTDNLTRILEKSVNREIQAAREKLGSFNLEELVITQKGGFDMRFNKSKEYLAQCSAAEVDPVEYYHENIDKEKSSVVQETKNDSDNGVKSLKETSYYKGDSGSKTKGGKDNSEEKLVHNMDGSLDMRYKKNQEVAMRIAEAKERLSKIDVSKLVKTKTGKIDGRFKENKVYLELLKQCEESYYL